MKLTKEVLRKTLKQLESLHDDVNGYSECIDKYRRKYDFISACDGFYYAAFAIIEDVLDDIIDIDENIIAYYIDELDFGRNKMAENCIKWNGKNYSLRNIDELWDYICDSREYEE